MQDMVNSVALLSQDLEEGEIWWLCIALTLPTSYLFSQPQWTRGRFFLQSQAVACRNVRRGYGNLHDPP